MRPINLIPAEDRRGERAPLRAGPLSYVVVVTLLLAFVGAYLLVSTGNTISERETEFTSLEQQLESSRARAEALQSFSQFAALEQSRTETVSTLARSRFDWERVMRELALVIPDDVSLTSLVGAVSSEAAGAGGNAADIAAPTLTLRGCTANHESVARFVAALRDIDGVTRVGLASSARGGAGEGAAATTVPSTSSTGSGGGCAGTELATFDVTVAFDAVQVDESGAGIVPDVPAPEPGDGSGVAEAQTQHDAAKESVESAQEKSRDAVDTFVPGA